MINEERFQEFDTILISCDTNDIDNASGTEVHTELMSLVNFIYEKYPTRKIIISHITPRKDELNKEELVCNALLDQSVKQSEHMFLVVSDDEFLKICNSYDTLGLAETRTESTPSIDDFKLLKQKIRTKSH